MCYIETTNSTYERRARKIAAKFRALEREEQRRNKDLMQRLGRTAEAIRAITYAKPEPIAAASTQGEFYPTAAERASIAEFVNVTAHEAAI